MDFCSRNSWIAASARQRQSTKRPKDVDGLQPYPSSQPKPGNIWRGPICPYPTDTWMGEPTRGLNQNTNNTDDGWSVWTGTLLFTIILLLGHALDKVMTTPPTTLYACPFQFTVKPCCCTDKIKSPRVLLTEVDPTIISSTALLTKFLAFINLGAVAPYCYHKLRVLYLNTGNWINHTQKKNKTKKEKGFMIRIRIIATVNIYFLLFNQQ